MKKMYAKPKITAVQKIMTYFQKSDSFDLLGSTMNPLLSVCSMCGSGNCCSCGKLGSQCCDTAGCDDPYF